MKKTIELQANTTTPPGATIRLTVEYRSKIILLRFFFVIILNLIEMKKKIDNSIVLHIHM